ncbi:NADAR family protein [Kitasatospora sp. DSM 101779]|uniref:NADAR family protein n=1 Tax=Kitasatospora sp. DSM 101779 TaxID=2853165 RepID=UPI0021D9D309|nr:NADAR family protein [Kitasatospora sp. DSM 101779]MCU7824898.1 NADAR family protein [Kitasatospora sp. DSM 101779]
MTTTEPTTPADTRTREQLVTLVAAGAQPKYLLFWGHRPEPDGRIGPGSLSQWWPGEFTVDGVTYRSAEHWMMAGKARLFQDEQTLTRILAAPTPGEAKKLGRLVRGFDEQRWVAERFELVVAGNVAKFGQDEALRNYLLGTSQRVLVEASPLDRLWGIGLAADNERAARPHEWRGLNLLGFALMEARARLTA